MPLLFWFIGHLPIATGGSPYVTFNQDISGLNVLPPYSLIQSVKMYRNFFLIMCKFSSGLWGRSRSPSNFGRLEMELEPEPEIWVPSPESWYSCRVYRLGYCVGVCNLRSVTCFCAAHDVILCGNWRSKVCRILNLILSSTFFKKTIFSL